MPPKALAKSPRMPAGPVTYAVRPSGRPWRTVFLSCSTISVVSEPAGLSGTMSWAACLSSAGTGPITCPAKPCTEANALARSLIAARSSGVSSPLRSKTMRAGNDSWSANRFCHSATAVASADAGRNDALSFCWTSDSFPCSGPVCLTVGWPVLVVRR
jgi:hypothetical protein